MIGVTSVCRHGLVPLYQMEGKGGKRDKNSLEKGSEGQDTLSEAGLLTFRARLQLKRNPVLCRLDYGMYSPRCFWGTTWAEQTLTMDIQSVDS